MGYEEIQLSEAKTFQKFSKEPVEKRFAKEIEWILRQKPGKILELGCASGGVGDFLVKKNREWEYFGLELNPEFVSAARKKKLNIQRFDLNNSFPFKKEEFDLVVSIAVLEHLLDPRHFLCECNRVLKPGAVLILSTPNLASIANRLMLLLGKQPYLSEGHLLSHFKTLTHSKLLELFDFSGFELKEFFSATNPKIYFPLRVLAKIRKPFGDNLIYLLEKKSTAKSLTEFRNFSGGDL